MENLKKKVIINISKSKKIFQTFLFLLVGIFAIFQKVSTGLNSFWPLAIIGLYGFFFHLFQLLNRNNVFVDPATAEGKKIIAEVSRMMLEDKGIFMFGDTGFSINGNGENYSWRQIETLLAFKEDRLTTDEICLDIIFKSKKMLRLSESTKGWYQFIERLNNHFPGIPINWDTDIALPPFATNLTLLYDSKRRNLEEAVEASFNSESIQIV